MKVLAFLLDKLAGPLAAPGDRDAFAFGLRVVAWDATVIDVPDAPGAAKLADARRGKPLWLPGRWRALKKARS